MIPPIAALTSLARARLSRILGFTAEQRAQGVADAGDSPDAPRAKRNSGAALIFALTAFPIVLAATSVIELGLISVTSSTMAAGVEKAAEAHQSAEGCPARWRMVEEICSGAGFLPQCADQLVVQSVVLPTDWRMNRQMRSIAASAGVLDDDPTAAAPAAQRDQSPEDPVVIVSASYSMPVVSPLVAAWMVDASGEYAVSRSAIRPVNAACGA